ncbi:MAG: hypothetical protein HYX96_09465 [Chloroflexi bacterium]|nr:hypothetical protein [Chloroflexota bacterium]
MAGKLVILDPTAEAGVKAAAVSPFLETLKGKRIALVSNEGWPCMPVMWQRLTRQLMERFGAGEVVKIPVPMQQAAPPQVINDILSRADAAIAGLAI